MQPEFGEDVYKRQGWYMWDDELIEGKGVVPDLLIKPTLETLRNGRDVQMETALETARTL